MEKINNPNKYTYDVAISLCNQDLEFARKLVKTLNPSLEVFFYEDRQADLISKSGPEMFAKTFKELSRVVVVLSRKSWSESFYTEIERNAIIDRTAVKNMGYQFLMVLPMIEGEVPSWYPSTHIYANPFRFSIEELAHFIEFKVLEQGGEIKPVTVEGRYQNLLDRIDEKKHIVQLQEDSNAIQAAKEELSILKNCFNDKCDFFKLKFIDSISLLQFYDHSNHAFFGLGEYGLECRIVLPDIMGRHIVTTQDIWIYFELFQTSSDNEPRKSLELEQSIFHYTSHLKGWSQPLRYEQVADYQLPVLFRNAASTEHYDLTRPINTLTLVDNWFQNLLSKSTLAIERYI